MKTIAYLCTYKQDDISSFEELRAQRNLLYSYCVENNYELSDIFSEENSARDDLKPVLLNIISNYYGIADRLVVANSEIISRDDSFREWVEEELERIGIKIVYVQPPQKSEKKVTARAIHIKDKVKSIPSLPEVVLKVMQLVQDKNSSAAILSKVISHDPGLTTRVLRLVNSSYYGFPKQISTIQHAITILGFTTIRGLVLSSSIYKMFSPKNASENLFDYKKFWKHNLLTAIGAKKLANEQVDIFSSAILHDLGKIILAQYDYNNYSKAYALTCGSLDYERNMLIEERECETNHCEIAHLVASSWNLPQSILDVILYHHTPLKSENHKFSCIMVNVANILANVVLYNKELDLNLFDFIMLEDYGISETDIYQIHEMLLVESRNIEDIERFFK